MNEDSWSVTEPRTLDFKGVAEVRVALVRGRFDIVMTEGTGTTLEISEVGGQPLEVRYTRGTLKVEHFNSSNWLQRLVNFQQAATAVISITVPAGTRVSASTVRGDGMVSGSARTTLRTVTGSLMADATEGSLSIDTVSGEVIARDHHGSLTIKSVSGEVTASGEMREVKANSVSGNISLDLQGTPVSVSAKSVSGEIRLRVPSAVGVSARATSASGTLLLDQQRFSNLGQNTTASSGPDSPRMMVNTSTVSGAVSIIHAPVPEPHAPPVVNPPLHKAPSLEDSPSQDKEGF